MSDQEENNDFNKKKQDKKDSYAKDNTEYKNQA